MRPYSNNQSSHEFNSPRQPYISQDASYLADSNTYPQQQQQIYEQNYPPIATEEYGAFAQNQNQNHLKLARNFHSGEHSDFDMPSPPQNVKLDLDARAAVLKEKLLKSRSQSQAARLNSASPANEAEPKARAAPNASRLGDSSPGPSPSERAKPPPPQFVPHQMPRPPPQTIVPADANDIAALITSISSTTRSNENSSSNTIKQQAKAADKQTNVPPRQYAKPQTATPSPLVSAPAQPRLHNGSQQATPQGRPGGNPPVGSSKLRAPSYHQAASPSSGEEGEITSEGGGSGSKRNSSSTENPETAPASGPSEHKPKEQASSAATAKNMNRSYDAAAGGKKRSPIDLSGPSPKTREQGYRPSTTTLRTAAQTYKPADRQKLANGGGNGNEKDERNTNVEDGNRGRGPPPNSQTGVRPASTPLSTDALSRAIEHDQDLRDWLIMTDYHDVEARNRKLERHRKARALAAEKERIEAEQRKLIEEEELELGFRRAPVATPSAAPTPTTASVVTPLTSKPATERRESFQAASAKRNYDEDDDKTGPIRPEKQLRMDDRVPRTDEIGLGIGEGSYRARDNRPASRADTSDARPGPRSRGTSPRRDPSPRRGYSPRRGTSPGRAPSPRRNAYPNSPPRRDYRRSPPAPYPRDFSPHRSAYPTGPRFRPEHEGRGEDRFHRQNGYRNDNGRRRDTAQFPPTTARIDLGGKGDTRFFIVKSFNEDNVKKCMEDGVWATQTKNGQLLTSAFANCRNVILFFSINKSRAFQGFARMATTPSPDTPRPKWMNGIHWDTSPPFRVEWLSKVPVEFFRIGHLKNSYNENMPVLVGKDGQEIEESCGRELLYEMQAFADERIDGDGGMRNPHAPHGPTQKGPHGGGKKGKWQDRGHGQGQGSGQFHAHKQQSYAQPQPQPQPQAPPPPGPSNVKIEEEDW
ncbi:YT521-B-like domain-containing protein [Cercophora scortea]|uniref:YT521-B-like domain-containing protein n=1 Tax=Cercophora scortea TaxID=314031 RepID=A0AAE0IYQ7_9PEZI|nr:YT521-B-like domain-containing protein [Cercophora scortea]